MDWSAYIDAYCERTSPAFWSEPLNALTNAAFILAALFLTRNLRRAAAGPMSIWLLVALLFAIGIGSFLFHTFATRWAELADVVPIYLFMHLYVAVFLRWVIGWRWSVAWLGVPAFFLFAWVLGRVIPARTLGLSGYAPALLVLVGFAGWLALRGERRWRQWGLAATVFAVSLALRQLDLPLCAQWPLGTHFAWHLLNAVTLYLATRALFEASRGRPQARPVTLVHEPADP